MKRTMRTLFLALAVTALVPACSSSSGEALTAEQQALVTYLRARFGAIFGPSLSSVTDALAILADPEALAAAGATFEEDDSPGAPDNSYVFNVPLDTTGDGQNDATIDGTAITSGDPLGVIGKGFTVDVDFVVGFADGSTLRANLSLLFRLGSVEVSGTGSFTDVTEGFEGTFSIDPAAPGIVRIDQEGDGNLCAADVQGDVMVSMAPIASAPAGLGSFPPGALEALYRFFFGNRTIRVTNARYNDPVAGETSVPDSTITAPSCDRSAVAEQWLGNWTYTFLCPPDETGVDAYSITLQDENTLRAIVNGGSLDFTATLDPMNPRRATGFFIDTDDGGTYREDFVWTLAPDGTSWSQVSTFVYQSGPLQGVQGDCTADAVR